MRLTLLVFGILIHATVVMGQATSSVVEVITTYSQNEKFYLKSKPYDNEFPSLRGTTSVFEKGSKSPLYIFERGFDSVDTHSNNLILSNDGQVICYVIPWEPDEQKDGLKSITIYKKGKILKSFTETAITGCDKKVERCSLVYSNYDEVVDREKSNWGTGDYRKVFRAGVSEKERFLSDFPIFTFDDIMYLTDSKKKVHLFDLRNGDYIRSELFEVIFDQLKTKARFNKTEIVEYEAPIVSDFPRLKNGANTYESLARHLGMKASDLVQKQDEQYKLYSFEMDSIISRDGSLEIEGIEFHDDLPKEKIIEFFKVNKFDSRLIPKGFEKWAILDEFFSFRKQNDRIARQEKQQQRQENLKETERRMTSETIGGVYIPKDLGECFSELDKLLTEIDKKEMQALPDREHMIRYHHGLGMWMRNNWGLWGGSRLQKYFRTKGVSHPDEMSSVVLYHYHDWLNGKKETWKDWEKHPKK